jgi:hypothetical protein
MNTPTGDNRDRACSRLIAATTRIIDGARMQRDRVIERSNKAPRILEDSPYEVIDLTGQPGNDLDYYAYELARLQDAAREVIRVFDRPPEVADALANFDCAVPNLRAARNPLTHTTNDARLDDVAWFSSLVRLKADGSTEDLVDPRYAHHDAAEELAGCLLSFLRSTLRDL